MKILLDGHVFNSRIEGNKRYIKELYLGLRQISGTDTSLYKRENSENGLKRLLFGMLTMARNIKADIVHSTYISPFIKTTKQVVTVHDLSFKQYPNYYSIQDKFIFNFLLPWSLYQADAIIVPSCFTANELLAVYPQYKHKIHVINYASGEIFKPILHSVAKLKIHNLLDITYPYILVLNSRYKKKNINNVIKAFNNLKNCNTSINLVVVGGKHNIDEKLKESSNLVFIDYVDDATLACLYQCCELFIYYSTYEGFGLPLLEAVGCHAPIIASDIPVHREITQNKLIYVDPYKHQLLSTEMKRILQNSRLGENLVKRSQMLNKLYSWKETVNKTQEVYKKII